MCCGSLSYDNPEVCCGGEVVPDVLCCGNTVLDEGQSCCGDGATEVPYSMADDCCINNGERIEPKIGFDDYTDCPDRVTKPGYSVTPNGCSSPYGDDPVAGDATCKDEPLTNSTTFVDACDAHDMCSGGQCYAPGVDGFGDCNAAFFDDMLDVCDGITGSDCRLTCLQWAYIYYAFVGGQLQKTVFFDPGQQQACKCCP